MHHSISQHRCIQQLHTVVLFFIHSFLRHTTPGCHATTSSRGGAKRVKLLPDAGTTRTTLSSLRIAYLAALARDAIASNCLLTKRDVYYLCRALFPDMRTVDRTLASLERMLRIARNDLNVVAAPKGLVSGPVSFVDEASCAVNVALFDMDAVLIPPRPERMRNVVVNAQAIIVYVVTIVVLDLLLTLSSHGSADRLTDSVAAFR